jgi:hypothetical protein
VESLDDNASTHRWVRAPARESTVALPTLSVSTVVKPVVEGPVVAPPFGAGSVLSFCGTEKKGEREK